MSISFRDFEISFQSCFQLRTLTRLFAFFQCFEIISISTATTKGESFAATFGLIEIKSRETCSAKSCHFWKETIAHTLRGHQIFKKQRQKLIWLKKTNKQQQHHKMNKQKLNQSLRSADIKKTTLDNLVYQLDR